jgi:hypothetical protein
MSGPIPKAPPLALPSPAEALRRSDASRQGYPKLTYPVRITMLHLIEIDSVHLVRSPGACFALRKDRMRAAPHAAAGSAGG